MRSGRGSRFSSSSPSVRSASRCGTLSQTFSLKVLFFLGKEVQSVTTYLREAGSLDGFALRRKGISVDSQQGLGLDPDRSGSVMGDFSSSAAAFGIGFSVNAYKPKSTVSGCIKFHFPDEALDHLI